MRGEPPITTTGTITETLSNGIYLASLPNGKIVHAHPGDDFERIHPGRLQPGDRVQLELTPFDFSKARIAAIADS